VLSWKVSKFSITFIFCTFTDSVPVSVSGVLRDRRQSESESVIKVPPLVHGVRTIIISSSFIWFWHISNDWKAREDSHEFAIASFLERWCLGGQNEVVPGGSSMSAQTYSSSSDVQKFITLRPFVVSVHVNNRRKDKRVFYNSCMGPPSDSSHIRVRIEFSNCCSQSSRIWCRCDKLSFWSFLGGFKDGHPLWCFNIVMGRLPCFSWSLMRLYNFDS
jgi:hypothetical protein